MTLGRVLARWAPSAECCSKSKFSSRGNLGFISNSQGTVEKALFVKQHTKQFPCLVSPTPPSGCQAQGVNISKINMIYNKINNNAIK
jgi:hypothetical protein